MKSTFAITLLWSTALVAAAGAQTPAPSTANQPTPQAQGAATQPPATGAPSAADCDRLLTMIEQRQQGAASMPPETVRTYRANANFQACRDGLERMQGSASARPAGSDAASAEGAQINVQAPAPTIRVQQAQPQVAVQQARPTVTVQQQRPEILVRQPQATVRVDIPQPEITIRMPEPNVDVALGQPEVSVTQGQPRVQVTQPEAQAAVRVQRQANAEADVNVQAATQQPQIRYERAEPRVIVNQQGQPQVRFERMREPGQQAAGERTAAQQQATRTQAQGQAAGTEAQRQAMRTEAQRRAYQQRFGSADGAAAGQANAAARPFLISDIDERDVYNARGERLGEIDRVIVSPADNRRWVVVAHGGFLGIGEDRVALPLERFAVRGEDRLVIRGVTEEDIDAMDNWRNQVADYRNMSDGDQVRLSVMQ